MGSGELPTPDQDVGRSNEMTAGKFTRVRTETAFLNAGAHRRLDEFLHLARQLHNAALRE